MYLKCSSRLIGRVVAIAMLPLLFESGLAQVQDQEAEFDSAYALRIQMEEIDGVYIPANLGDAFDELQRLSTPADLEKFKLADEQTVRDKLHFGLGRWMIYNWGFYQGSRLSHYLKELGLEHPDDMAKFLLVSFHRHLNDQPLNIEEQIDYYAKLREQERLDREKSKELIHQETRIKKN